MERNRLRGLVFVLSGPSGSGKTTLAERVLQDRTLGRKLARSISYATRPQRSGELEGKHYFFITNGQFKEALKAKKILEWTRYLGYYYATPKDFFESRLKKGKHLILCLDVKGALRIKRQYPKNTVTVFVVPPSLEVLSQRMRNRCSATKTAEIRKRVRLAAQELLSANRYDYCLVNRNLDKVAAELKGLILEKIRNLKKKEG
ncbi:MAG TPA: guanylate kinase [Patescibacteria group bacterium]|nr:guanylate kinase [Patescibacteria group bacterium]